MINLLTTPSVYSSLGRFTTASSIVQELQMQILSVADFDNHLRFLNERLKGVNKIRSLFRDNLNVLNTILAKRSESNKKNKNPVVMLTPHEAAQMMRALTRYDLSCKDGEWSIVPESLRLSDAGDNNKWNKMVASHPDQNFPLLNEDHRETRAEEYAAVFDAIDHLGANKKSREMARQLGGDGKGDRFFYVSDVKYGFENGWSKIGVFVDSITRYSEIINNKISDTDIEIEDIKTQITQLVEHRKQALDNVVKVLSKLDETKSKAQGR